MKKKCAILLLCSIGAATAVPIQAQIKPKNIQTRSVFNSVPYGYTQVGNTRLYYKKSNASIDILGCFNSQYYSSTYNDGGYKLAMQVNKGSSTNVDCLNGTTIDNVTCTVAIEQQGEFARVSYLVNNANEKDAIVSLGTHADVKIGNNDQAPISKRIDTAGKTYGVTMKDGNGSQLCVLFGSGLAGVTSISDYWFGYYALNNEAYQMVGNYYSGSNFMEENGSYDSGMGWCWKDRTIPAGSTVTFSYLIGVGEVSLEPTSSFEVTPNDPEGWNDLTRPHKLAIEGTYDSPAGLDGMIEYAVETSEDWQPLTDLLHSGATFKDSLVAMFDASREKHVIRFRTKDNVGNTTLLPSIEYQDVSFHQYSGIEDKTYTGDSIYQNVTCTDVADMPVTTAKYINNINAGTAMFCIEGVFPYSIGRKTCSFNINPVPLTGTISLSSEKYVYNGQHHTPTCTFTNEAYATLIEGKDFNVGYTDNVVPGTAKAIVKGIGNYTSELSKEFYIDKALLSENLYSITLPSKDVSYDGLAHKAMASTERGVGTVNFTYTLHGNSTALPESPKEEGSYDVYAEIAEGDFYYGKPSEYVGSFTIYKFDETEWQSLGKLILEIQQMGFSLPWDMTGGAKNVSKFEGLDIKEGHVIGITLANKGLTGLFPMSIAAFPKLEALDISGNLLSGDIATGILAMKMKDADIFSNLHALNISKNQYSGNVGLLGKGIPSLTSLDVSNNKFEDLYPALPSSLTDLDISHQEMDKVTDLNMSDLSVADIASKVPTILLYNKNTHEYNASLNLLCTKADLDAFNKYDTEEWAMQLKFADAHLSIPYVSTQNAYFGESGDTLNVLNMINDDDTDGSRFRIKLSFNQGDANFVNGVDAADLQATILYAFGAYRNYPFNFTAANTFKDESINVQDVIYTVNILLASNEKQSMKTRGKEEDTSRKKEEAEAHIFARDGKIILNSNIPVASLSIKAEGDIKWNIDATTGLQQSTAHGNVVAYSLNGITIPSSQDVVLGEYTHATVHSASLSDAEAQSISVGIGSDTSTGIDEVMGADMNHAEIFNASGCRTKTTSKGINIIRQRSKVHKIYKK